jgi:hypothetical protein
VGKGKGANTSLIHYSWACYTFHLLMCDPVNETKFRALDVTVIAILTNSEPPTKAKVIKLISLVDLSSTSGSQMGGSMAY